MGLPTSITRFNRDVLNPLTLRLAGRGAFADLRHRGRRSGQDYHTPVMAFRDVEQHQIVIALTYGPRVQWLKNVTHSGRCSLRLGDNTYELGAPLRIPAQDALPVISQPQRTLLRWPIRCGDFVAFPIINTTAVTQTKA